MTANERRGSLAALAAGYAEAERIKHDVDHVMAYALLAVRVEAVLRAHGLGLPELVTGEGT